MEGIWKSPCPSPQVYSLWVWFWAGLCWDKDAAHMTHSKVSKIVCMHGCVYTCHGVWVESWGKLAGVASLFLPCGSQGPKPLGLAASLYLLSHLFSPTFSFKGTFIHIHVSYTYVFIYPPAGTVAWASPLIEQPLCNGITTKLQPCVDLKTVPEILFYGCFCLHVCLCVCVCVVPPENSKKHYIHWTEVVGYELLCGCWELSLGLLRIISALN